MAIVHSARRKSENHQVLSFQSGFRDLENDSIWCCRFFQTEQTVNRKKSGFRASQPSWSVLEFWKIKLEKSSSTNWIFSLQKSISKLIFAGYTGSKNPVRNRLKIQFVELDFSKLIFQKSSTDQQGVRGMSRPDNRGTMSRLFWSPHDVWKLRM